MSMDDTDYLDLARFFGGFSTCKRLYVGAVLAMDKRIISTGYNGAPAGLAHCVHDDVTPCTRAVHAEANCISFAARHGIATEGAVLYSTHMPCISCAQLIINSGIRKVVYGEAYRKTEGQALLREAGIPVVQLDGSRLYPVPTSRGYGPSMYTCERCGSEVLEGASHNCGRSTGSERGINGHPTLR